MTVYKVQWSVPIVQDGLKSYETVDLSCSFKHRRTAVRFRNQMVNAYEFIGFDNASTYVRLTEEELI